MLFVATVFQLLSVSAGSSVSPTGVYLPGPYDALDQHLTWQTSFTAVECRAADQTSLYD